MQDYCLAMMGIHQWQLKSNSVIQKPYLLLLNEVLNDEKNQLLMRLLQAMKWQDSADIIEIKNISKQQLIEKISLKQVLKVVIFGEVLTQLDTIAAQDVTLVKVASVDEMLVSVQAKKKAWERLKAIM